VGPGGPVSPYDFRHGRSRVSLYLGGVMDHCKDKKRHKWANKYGAMVECSVCHKIKMFKTTQKGRKYAKGAFGNASKV
jgi:hypothetical protein